MGRPLPRPATAVELYLAAIHNELQAIRDILGAPQAQVGFDEPAETLLRELAGKEAANSSVDEYGASSPALPAGFPGRAELEAAGISTLADVPRTAHSLKAIKGIGPATATAILQELGKS